MNTANAHLYGVKNGKPGRAYIRTRGGARGVGLIIGTNAEGEATITLYINQGRENTRAKLRLWEFKDALDTAIRTAP